MKDPITELVAALETHGNVSFAWTVRWSHSDREPVESAWHRSRSPADLVKVLELAQHPSASAARKLLFAEVLWSSDHDFVRAEAIRRLVPVPPTLSDLVGSRRGTLRFASGTPSLGLRTLGY